MLKCIFFLFTLVVNDQTRPFCRRELRKSRLGKFKSFHGRSALLCHYPTFVIWRKSRHSYAYASHKRSKIILILSCRGLSRGTHVRWNPLRAFGLVDSCKNRADRGVECLTSIYLGTIWIPLKRDRFYSKGIETSLTNNKGNFKNTFSLNISIGKYHWQSINRPRNYRW